MSVKYGQMLTVAGQFVVDRLQTTGVSNLNIPIERIEEVGNFETVATIRDIPDLSFEAESFDMSTEFEALMLRLPPSDTAGIEYDFNKAIPMDVISPFKTGQALFTIINGVVLPYLTLESVTYRFGVRANSTQTATFRGDSVYYVPGTPYFQEFNFSSGTALYSFTNTAIVYNEPGTASPKYALGVCYYDPATRLYKRLFDGPDYTDTASGITLTAASLASIPTGSKLSVVYGSTTQATYSQGVHEDVTVKPAAVRGKDVDIYLAPTGSSTFTRWGSVQSFEANRRVTLDADEELGNKQYVSQDYNVPEVNGNVVVRPRDVAELFAKIQELGDVPTNEVVGPFSSTTFQLEARVYDPNAATPTTLKTIYVPDARFTPPGIQGRVGSKIEPTFNWESDSGRLLVYSGARP